MTVVHDNLEKTEAKSLTIVHERELFIWPLGLALFCALAAAIRHALSPIPES